MNVFKLPSLEQKVNYSPLNNRGIELWIKRDDLIHPEVSGNKWRKLKWNIADAIRNEKKTILTFGGAFSNHIAATAAAAKIHGLQSIGIIRGEETDLNNPTLSKAINNGMHIHRVSRSSFKNIGDRDCIEMLRHQFGSFYLIPQGGENYYGMQGCMEIMSELERKYDKIFVACGTATTLSGLLIGNTSGSKIYGVSALKGGDFLKNTVAHFVSKMFNDHDTETGVLSHFDLLTDYHFGGYAKVNDLLINFMRNFASEAGVKLDPIYTAKTAFAMTDWAESGGDCSNEKWLFIHSGGMQGLQAMESRLGEKIY